MPLGMEVDLGPGHIVLDGDPAPPERGTAAPLFSALSIVAKRSPISATEEHSLKLDGVRSPLSVFQPTIFCYYKHTS